MGSKTTAKEILQDLYQRAFNTALYADLLAADNQASKFSASTAHLNDLPITLPNGTL